MAENSKLPREIFKVSPSKDKTNPLIEPRAMGAITLAAFGTFGVSLMLARVLMVVGLAISLLCSAGIVWIYFDHFRLAYTSLSNKTKYKGASPKELVVAVIVISILLPVSLSVYFMMSEEPPNVARPIIFLDSLQALKHPGSSKYTLNVILLNKGSVAALDLFSPMTGRVSDHLINQDDIDKEIDELDSALTKGERLIEPPHTQMQPGAGGVITLQDISTNTWRELLTNPKSGIAPPTIELSDEEWNDVTQGKKVIYVIYVAHFGDEFLSGSGYWKVAQCAYFTMGQNFYHNCNRSRAEKVSGVRFRH